MQLLVSLSYDLQRIRASSRSIFRLKTLFVFWRRCSSRSRPVKIWSNVHFSNNLKLSPKMHSKRSYGTRDQAAASSLLWIGWALCWPLDGRICALHFACMRISSGHVACQFCKAKRTYFFSLFCKAAEPFSGLHLSQDRGWYKLFPPIHIIWY
jgi:hypothetical protein